MIAVDQFRREFLFKKRGHCNPDGATYEGANNSIDKSLANYLKQPVGDNEVPINEVQPNLLQKLYSVVIIIFRIIFRIIFFI